MTAELLSKDGLLCSYYRVMQCYWGICCGPVATKPGFSFLWSPYV